MATALEAGAGLKSWTTRREDKAARLAGVAAYGDGKLVRRADIVPLLQGLLRAGDRVALEGNNQKQADFLSRSLVEVDPGKVHGLHMLISSITRPEHLTLFERGKLEIAALHTYIELYARMFVDLPPQVVLVCAEKADLAGNLYTGPNTEETPTLIEAAAFSHGIVLVQVNEVVDRL